VRLAAAAGGEPGPWLEVVGVAPDLAMSSDPQSDAAGMYQPATPGLGGAARMAVRVRGDPEALAPRLRALAAAVDPALRLYDLLPLEDVARMEQAGSRVFASLLALVAAIALLLSTVGLYALMSFAVAQRTREIGIRSALGADPRRIVAAIFSRALRQLALGVAAGAAAAVLFGALGPGDQIAREGPWLLLAVSALMLLVGLASCVVPARRGLAIQPTEALKSAG
jgi:predicted lysophospholipase L1 biosynthesis ABC-type transport system permease subunit